jgi:2-polyprenyl-3-methyl-5-hydroxy-6-metoxy-1,4-benzoquinol methylase
MLISDEYLEQNRRLHEGGSYGISGLRWAPNVARLAAELGCKTILDYGCGKQTLAEGLKDSGLIVRGYDPAIKGMDAPSEQAEIVVCIDVLEHIEPEYLDNVLIDIARCVVRAVFLVVHTQPALKTLSDGRNAHLIQQPYEWWLPKFTAHWDRVSEALGSNGFRYTGVVRTHD